MKPALPLILIAATALRFFRLDGQSLWSDEGNSLAQARRGLAAIAERAANDIHPPGYYWLLHGWVGLFGTSEVGLRSLSVLAGVLLVVLCYLLAKALFGTRVARMSGFLAAVNPLLVNYSQEARMYALMAALGALAVYATVRLAGDGGHRRWAWIYWAAAVAGLYTHYLFPIVLLGANGFMALRWVGPGSLARAATGSAASPAQGQSSPGLFHWNVPAGRDGYRGAEVDVAQGGLSWLRLQFAVALAFLPWLPTAVRQLRIWPAGAQEFGLAEAPRVLVQTLSLGPSARPEDGAWLLAFGGLALIGAAAGLGRRRRATALLLMWLLLPVAVMLGAGLLKASFLKFLIVAVPPFLILVALGIARLADGLRSRVVAGLIAITVLVALSVPTARSLRAYYFDPALARDDYRGMAGLIAAIGRPGDAVILDAPGQQEIFGYYHRGAAPVYPLPLQRPPDRIKTEEALAEIASRHDRVFVLFWATDESDPERIVEGWLDAHAFKAIDSWYGNVRLVLYANPRQARALETKAGLSWTQGIRLRGYSLEERTFEVGEVVPLTLYWQAGQAIAARYKVFVHLLDARGLVIAQRDTEPVGGSRPTDGWRVGETIVDPHGLFIPYDTPSGRYALELGLYDAATGGRLELVNGQDHALPTELDVERPSQPPPRP